MKKTIKKLYELLSSTNLLFVCLLVIIFIRLFNSFSHLDNDIWFILSSGRYVVHNWIPYYDPLTMHEGFVLIMQQWLTASIYYLIYRFAGIKVFSFILSLVSISGLYVLYKFSKYLTNNKNISLLLMIFYTYFFATGFTTSRPQIITYLILTSELFLCEKYFRTNNKKYLYALPILSLLEINMHSSMWLLQICFVGTFLVNSLNDKKKFKELFITIIIMCIMGLINPYGIRAILYVFSSYGVSVLNDYINEMKPIEFSFIMAKISLVAFLLMIPLNRKAKEHFPIRYVLLLLGCSYLAFSHIKSLPYLGIAFVVSFSYLLRDASIKEIISKTKLKKILTIKPRINTKIFRLGIGVLCLITVIISYYTALESIRLDSPMRGCIEYLNSNVEDKNSITIYTTYEDGGYLEWNGYKPYIDPRGDVFLKSTNKKFDLMDEYVEARESTEKISNLLEKYKFDYVIVQYGSSVYKYLYGTRTNETHYKEVATSSDPDDMIRYHLYERIK